MIRFLRRWIPLCICFVITTGSIQGVMPAAAAGSQSETAYSEAELVLRAVGVLESFPQEDYTNGEFVQLLDRILFPEGGGSVLSMIPGGGDIQEDQWLTAETAAKILVYVCGYGYQVDSGDAAGYVSTARRIGVFDSVSAQTGQLSSGDAIAMLYNALSLDMAIPGQYGGDSISFVRAEGRTLLSEYMDVYHTEGLITENEDSALTGPGTVGKGNVRIEDNDGTSAVYKDENKLARDYLGYRAKVFYCYSEADNSRSILLCILSNRTRTLTIDGGDLTGLDINGDSRTIRYEAGGKAKQVVFDTSADILYNGMYVEYRRGVLDMINDCPAPYDVESVRLVDNNNDGVYDIVFVDVYRNIVVKMADKDDFSIYDLYGTPSVDLSENNNVSVTIRKADGSLTDFSYIGIQDVLSVKEAEQDGHKTVQVRVSRRTKNGKISVRRTDSDCETLTVIPFEQELVQASDKQELKPAGNLKEWSYKLKSNTPYTFFLDYRGRIAGYTNKNFVDTKTIADTYTYENYVAFVVGIARKSSFDNGLIFKLYAQNAAQTGFELKEFETGSGFRLNGAKVPDGLSGEALLSGLPHRMVTFQVNNRGELSMMESARAELTDGYLSSLNGGQFAELTYKTNGSTFYKNAVSMAKSAQTTVITVPAADVPKGEREDFFSYSKWPYLVNGQSYKVEGFVFSDKEFVPKFMLMEVNSLNEIRTTSVLLVKECVQACDENGEMFMKLTGFYNRTQVTYRVNDTVLRDATTEEPIDVHSGDLLWISLDGAGRINYAQRIYDYQKDDYDAVAEGTAYSSAQRVVIGTVYDVEDTYVQFVAKSKSLEWKNAEVHPSASYKMTVYEAGNAGEPVLKRGSVSDLIPAVYNKENPTRMVITSTHGEPREMFIYKK